MGRRLHALTITSIACLAACNAIIGLSGDYDVGGGGDGGAVDGNTSHTDALAPDATTGTDGEAPGEDAGTDATVDQFVPDAPYDALYPTALNRDVYPRDAATLDANAPRYCQDLTGEWFCFDFNGSDGVMTGANLWTAVDVVNGKVALSGTTGMPDHAELAQVWTDSGAAAKADVSVDFNAPPSTTTELILSFSFHVASAETTARIGTVSAFGVEYGLGVYGGATCFGAPCLGEVGPSSPLLATATPFDVDQWYRVQIDVKRDATNRWGSTITIDNHIVAQRASDAFPTSAAAVPNGTLTFGAFETASPMGTTQVAIDDVLFQVR